MPKYLDDNLQVGVAVMNSDGKSWLVWLADGSSEWNHATQQTRPDETIHRLRTFANISGTSTTQLRLDTKTCVYPGTNFAMKTMVVPYMERLTHNKALRSLNTPVARIDDGKLA